jgi:hypothetical protein
MRREHETAISSHCRLAAECVNPKFGHNRGSMSAVITVNSGYE